ncbi:sodium/calcium exchanger protein [Hirsutella rhossiliensis]
MSSSTIFASNAVAIVPLSALLTNATERVAEHVSNTVGAFLNISLGNLVELILFAALAHGHVRIVEASILGSVLVNLLLILGSALLVENTVNSEPTYNAAQAQLLACLLFVSMFTFLMPTAFESTFHEESAASSASLQMSRISSLVILAIYIVYLVYEIRLRPRAGEDLLASLEVGLESSLSTTDHRQLRVSSSLPPPVHVHHSQTLLPQTIRFADEETTRPVVQLTYMGSSPIILEPVLPISSEDKDDHAPDSRGRQRSSGCCNIAEYVTVVAVAARNKLDLAIHVSIGSSIQIALCVTPLTVIAGWILHRDLALTFSFFEMASLLGAVLLVNILVLSESGSSIKTGGLKGALLCACYFIIGLGAYFAPETVV